MAPPRPKPIVLIILDGWGINPRDDANAIAKAAPPFYQSLLKTYANTILNASGEAVGLPKMQMGNSEVGHLNIGAGRVVYQEFTRITKAISDGSFFNNQGLQGAMKAAKKGNAILHLLGLLSDGGVHSHLDHLIAILDMAAQNGLARLRVHPFLDGRDTPPKSALGFIDPLEKELIEKAPKGADWKIATVTGRYYAMDRDKRWDRTEKSYRAIVYGEGDDAATATDGIRKSYDSGITDEFISPIVIRQAGKPLGKINDQDSVLFFNFRADRARQLSHALGDKVFSSFPREPYRSLSSFVSLTSYETSLDLPVAFESVQLIRTLGEVLSDEGLRQLRIAETEKYAHVTYFFNGGREEPFAGEERIMIPSPKEVKTYDQKPEMSAFEVTEEVLRQIGRNRFDFICINFANPDMVGHSGLLNAAIKAVETVDTSLKKIVEVILEVGGIALITADHGNLEQMIDYKTGLPHTAHTTHPVPFICASREQVNLRPGTHADIAPTILDLMQIPKPVEMDHDSLIIS